MHLVSCTRRIDWKRFKIQYRRVITAAFHKDVNGPFPNKYKPEDVESGWYEYWNKQGLFQPNNQIKQDSGKGANCFSMILPPPNVTGDLHLGHALTVAIQDSIARWRRAKGDAVLWIPGYDHAGIATQVVIEKKLKAETGRLRHQISQQEFIHHANLWKNKKIAIIGKQLQSLGASLDWSRVCFTMDTKFEKSVVEAFVRLYESGLIERKTGLVNWCCHLQSAISDIEVENVEVSAGDKYRVPGTKYPVHVGRMIYLAYPIYNPVGKEEVIVATTRPETIFGDVAIAVHPNDHRFTHLIGQRVCHPLDGRLLPIIADDSVQPDFGSGCVKITPAHDHRDFQIAERHCLPMLTIMDLRGNLTTNLKPFKGLSRFEARDVVVSELRRIGLLRDVQNTNTTIPVCSRTGDIVEPMLKDQWYMDCSQMFITLIEDIENKKLNVQPEPSKSSLLHWLSEKRKWCISRQLWWGHQIPAYKIISSDKGEVWVVGRTLSEAISNASIKMKRPVSAEELTRDEDVLDTWFSSALFPFAAFGWPDNDPMFEKFYPLSLMETGHDIIFFWVARMAVLGDALTGKKAFDQVLVHGLIRDAHGRKMSKSLGNVMDPMDIQNGISLQNLCKRSETLFNEGYISAEELKTARKSLTKDFPHGIKQCGADALRFALLTHDVKGQFINLSVSYIESCKPFCNKIWQTCRFYLLHLERCHHKEMQSLEKVELSAFDRWILSHLSEFVKQCETGFHNYELHMVTSAIRKFWHATLCDIYLEGIKPVLSSKSSTDAAKVASMTTLRSCIEVGIVAAAPIMPFLAEELFHRLKLWGEQSPASISLLPYPTVQQWEKWANVELDSVVEEVVRISALLRQLRSRYFVPSFNPEVHVAVDDDERVAIFSELQKQLESLGGCRVLAFQTRHPSTLPHSFIYRKVSRNLSLAVNLLTDIIDVDKCRLAFNEEKRKIEKELEEVNEDVIKPNHLSQAKRTSAIQKIRSLKQDLLSIENDILELSNKTK